MDESDYRRLGRTCECPACSSKESLDYQIGNRRWCWSIRIPKHWVCGNWESVTLLPVQVVVPGLSCRTCGAAVLLEPSFLMEGTTLTVQAVAFIAFAYENSGLTWRELSVAVCEEDTPIAHSTLFKAVQGLGERGRQMVESLKANLRAEFPPGWPPRKSRKPHTIAREYAVRWLFTGMLESLRSAGRFVECFFRQVHALRNALGNIVEVLYRT